MFRGDVVLVKRLNLLKETLNFEVTWWKAFRVSFTFFLSQEEEEEKLSNH